MRREQSLLLARRRRRRQRDDERAAAMLRLSLQEMPTWPPCYRFLASCCAHLGRLAEAHAIVKRLRDFTPLVIASAEHWRIPEQREFFLEGLRLAAGETK
jgi:hypothetical protein